MEWNGTLLKRRLERKWKLFFTQGRSTVPSVETVTSTKPDNSTHAADGKQALLVLSNDAVYFHIAMFIKTTQTSTRNKYFNTHL